MSNAFNIDKLSDEDFELLLKEVERVRMKKQVLLQKLKDRQVPNAVIAGSRIDESDDIPLYFLNFNFFEMWVKGDSKYCYILTVAQLSGSVETFAHIGKLGLGNLKSAKCPDFLLKRAWEESEIIKPYKEQLLKKAIQHRREYEW